MDKTVQVRPTHRIIRLFLLFALACALFALSGLGVRQAQAKSFTIPDVAITATVNPDGSMHVIENRTIKFSGDFSAVWWTFNTDNSKGYNGSYTVNSVSVDGKALPSVPFQTAWRTSGGSSTASYSIDSGQSGKYTTYVFSSWPSTQSTITLDYTVSGFVKDWADTGELYWQFIGDQTDVVVDNVTMNLTLPMPAGQTATMGDNVRIWGHGPLNGTVKGSSDGTVTYQVSNLPKNTYVEARVAFPGSWLTGMTPSAQSNLDTILSEEQGYANQANATRMGARVALGACWGGCLLVIVLCFLYFWKNGREYKTEFHEKYYRELLGDYHPSVIGRLWRWNKESTQDLTSTLMELTCHGFLRLDKATYTTSGVFKEKTKEDYRLTRDRAKCDRLSNPIDKEAVSLVFDTCAEGADEIMFSQISQYGKANPELVSDKFKSWQGEVTGAVNATDLFEAKGDAARVWMRSLAAGLVIAGFVLIFFLRNYACLPPFLIAAVVIAIIAGKMPRRTHMANELHAKCEAMKRWFEDFTILEERLPTDVAVWGEYLIYANIFGVADKVIKALQVKMPDLYNDPYMMGIYWWYMPYGGFIGGKSPVDSFDDMLTNTTSMMSAAMSSNSSGGGFGGGFSGGGGFGGGGGGFGGR